MSTEFHRRIIEWDTRIDRLSYEEILGVSSDASVAECREAYYRFARAFHPDVHKQVNDTLRQALTRIFQRGVEAYRVLTHPDLRSRWMRERELGAVRLADTGVAPQIDLNRMLPDLHLDCRSAGAKLAAKQAAASFMRGDFGHTRSCLQTALVYEGGANPDLQQCLDALSRLCEFSAGRGVV